MLDAGLVQALCVYMNQESLFVRAILGEPSQARSASGVLIARTPQTCWACQAQLVGVRYKNRDVG